MEQFEIILKNEKIKAYRFLALLLVLLNTAIFLFLLAYDSKRYEATAALMLTGIYIFMRIYLAKKNKHINYLIYIKVTNLKNHLSVIVYINDRLHPKNKRLIDLSRTAAIQLDFIGRGVTKVKVEVLGKLHHK